MNTQLSLLLIEDDMQACEEIEQYIASREDVVLLGMTDNAMDGVELVKYHVPDAVILDLELHKGGGNGLEFLSGMHALALEHEPYILVTTQNSSLITLDAARDLGADMIIAKYEKGYCAAYVIDTLCLMKGVICRRPSSEVIPAVESPADLDHKLRIRIQRELIRVGVSPKLKGYNYLTEAILLTYKDPGPNICQTLGQLFHVTPTSVERAMQNAINRTWNTASTADLKENYHAVINSERGVPTMMEFVHYYAALLKNQR